MPDQPEAQPDVRSPLVKVPPLHTAADDAIATDPEIPGMTDRDLIAGIDQLRRDRNAVILAHNYQVPAIQDLADFVGDSLQLAQEAATTTADVIAFCGVHFMAETAAILCPDKRVLIPDPEAGCSGAIGDRGRRSDLAAGPSRSGRGGLHQHRRLGESRGRLHLHVVQRHPDRARDPDDREILFLPDQFLGVYVEHVTGRRLHLWPGECHVHAAIRPDDIDALMAQYPDADLLLHPECGCVSQCLWRLVEGSLPAEQTLVLSTGGMARHARDCTSPVDLVGTEVGMLHRLRKENPARRFVPLREDAMCAYMKTITLPKLYRPCATTSTR